MKRALLAFAVTLFCGCSKAPLGAPCSSDWGCDSRAKQCLFINGKDQDGVCSRPCGGPADCAPEAICGRVSMKVMGGMLGKLGAGGTEAWCLPK